MTIDNETLFNDTITGVARIILSDNSSYIPSASDFDTLGRYHQGNTDNLTFTFTLDSTGSDNITTGDNLTLHAWAMDALGNVSSDNITSQLFYGADNVSPTDAAGELILLGVNTSDNQTFYINSATTLDNFSQTAALATDNGPSALNYFVTDNSSTPTDNTSVNAWGPLTSLSLSASDNLTVYVWAMDNASNVSATALDNLSVVFDNSTPTISSVKVFKTSDNTTDNVTRDNNTIMIEITGAADNIAVSYYTFSENSTQPSTWYPLTSGISVTDNLTGSHLVIDNSTADNRTVEVYVWVKDNASNVSDPKSDNISYIAIP